MIDKLMYIETSTDKYPIMFSLNVLESIQNEYGSYNKWFQMLESDEIDIKALKFGLMEAINEGIDIKNQYCLKEVTISFNFKANIHRFSKTLNNSQSNTTAAFAS